MVLVTNTLTCFGVIGHHFGNWLRDSSGKKKCRKRGKGAKMVKC